MALSDYTDTFELTKKKLYTVICIYHQMGYGMESGINRMLVRAVEKLKKELPEYAQMALAYVYETSGLMNARSWMPVEMDTKPYYKEPAVSGEVHSLSHVVYMSLAMLKKAAELDDNAELRLILVTDERLSRKDEEVLDASRGLVKNPAFEHLDVNLKILSADRFE